jgi:hypothetical protein
MVMFVKVTNADTNSAGIEAASIANMEFKITKKAVPNQQQYCSSEGRT